MRNYAAIQWIEHDGMFAEGMVLAQRDKDCDVSVAAVTDVQTSP
jgi:hypothetical protein